MVVSGTANPRVLYISAPPSASPQNSLMSVQEEIKSLHQNLNQSFNYFIEKVLLFLKMSAELKSVLSNS